MILDYDNYLFHVQFKTIFNNLLNFKILEKRLWD